MVGDCRLEERGAHRRDVMNTRERAQKKECGAETRREMRRAPDVGWDQISVLGDIRLPRPDSLGRRSRRSRRSRRACYSDRLLRLACASITSVLITLCHDLLLRFPPASIAAQNGSGLASSELYRLLWADSCSPVHCRPRSQRWRTLSRLCRCLRQSAP